MPDDSVSVRPSLPRLWFVFAVAMLPFAVIVATVSARYGDPVDFWFFVAATSIILAVGVLVLGLFARAFLLSFRVSAEGLEPCPSLLRTVVRWEDIDKVRVGLPFVFYTAGSALPRLPFPRFILLPKLWLVKNPDQLRDALERYAPEGHVLRWVLLGKDAPVLRETLLLVFYLLAAAAMVGLFLYR